MPQCRELKKGPRPALGAFQRHNRPLHHFEEVGEARGRGHGRHAIPAAVPAGLGAPPRRRLGLERVLCGVRVRARGLDKRREGSDDRVVGREEARRAVGQERMQPGLLGP